MINKHLIITISHQLGSGGAYLGQKLSESLGVPFIDREVLKKAAEQLNLAEAVLEGREERLSTFWQSSRKAWPSKVSVSLRVVRMSSLTPRRASSASSRRPMMAGVTFSLRAAAERLPRVETFTNAEICLKVSMDSLLLVKE